MWNNMRLILVVILLLILWPCVSAQRCPDKIIPPELKSPDSWSVQKAHTGFMSSVVHSFLNSVQPNHFPKGKFICNNVSLYFVLMLLCFVNVSLDKERNENIIEFTLQILCKRNNATLYIRL